MAQSFMENTRSLMDLIHQKMPPPSETQARSLREIYDLVKDQINSHDKDPVGATAVALNQLIVEHTIMLDHCDGIPTFRNIRRYKP